MKIFHLERRKSILKMKGCEYQVVLLRARPSFHGNRFTGLLCMYNMCVCEFRKVEFPGRARVVGRVYRLYRGLASQSVFMLVENSR